MRSQAPNPAKGFTGEQATVANWRGTYVQQGADLQAVADAVREDGKLPADVELHIKLGEAYFNTKRKPAVPQGDLTLLAIIPSPGELAFWCFADWHALQEASGSHAALQMIGYCTANPCRSTRSHGMGLLR